MSFWDYCKDKSISVLCHIAGMMFLVLFLLATGYPSANIILITSAWLAVAGGGFLLGFARRKRYFHKLDRTLEQLDQPYLIADMMDAGYRFEDKKYRQILRKSNKAVIERIHGIEQEQKEYREYMEGWVHEVKTPLTTIGLICENKKDDQARKILTELAKLDNDVETMLFYARADQVYQDYLIQPVNLYEVVIRVITKNKQLLIQNQVQPEITFSDAVVPSDPKWVEFILNQIVLNSVKYRRDHGAKITFSMQMANAQKSLIIKDNGIGILEEEQKRVFDKGFTGTNGRSHAKSTGIGLYLCKRLCDKLQIGIALHSKPMDYTAVILTFPDIAKDMPYLSKL